MNSKQQNYGIMLKKQALEGSQDDFSCSIEVQ
jgi:hypothetical protein